MKNCIAVLLLLTSAAYAEHAGRGMVRHSQPGMGQSTAPLAEIVELPRTVSHTAVFAASECKPNVVILATVEPATSTKYELFSAVEQAPKISDAFVEPPKPSAGELVLNPEVVALVEKLTARSDAKQLKAQEIVQPSTPVETGPTAEQLEIMQRDHLSIPPTLYNLDGSVRAAGKSSRGVAVAAPTATTTPTAIYYQNDFCPECQRKQRR